MTDLPPPISVAQPGTRVGFVRRYWQGGYSLPFSYFGVLVGFNLLTYLFLSQIERLPIEMAPRLIAGALIGVWVLLYMTTIWVCVGLWRAATRYKRLKPRRFYWAMIAQVIVLLSVGKNIDIAIEAAIPQSRALLQIVMQSDPDDRYQLRMREQGATLEVMGGMGFGLTGDVKAMLEANPHVRTIMLNSFGGRVAEARLLARLIEARKLDTYSSVACASACILPFAAGAWRGIADGAKLGFHQYSFPGVAGDDFDSQYMSDRAYLRSRGVANSFIDRIFSTPAEKLWEPSLSELLEAGFVMADEDKKQK